MTHVHGRSGALAQTSSKLCCGQTKLQARCLRVSKVRTTPHHILNTALDGVGGMQVPSRVNHLYSLQATAARRTCQVQKQSKTVCQAIAEPQAKFVNEQEMRIANDVSELIGISEHPYAQHERQ